MESPLPRASVPDAVFERLREAILAGRYVPGERLPTQRALAADLQVNIASVREALGRLEQLRLVDVRHGDATRVLDWRRSGGLEALAVMGSMDAQLAADLFEARRLLLGESARLAVGRRTEEQAGELRELAAAVAHAPDDGAALLADWAFMSALVAAAGNIVFQLIMNSVRELYLPRMNMFGGIIARRDDWTMLYARTAAAVRDGDGDGAAEAIAELAAAQELAMLGAR
jgi:DNA-binding FadR family transcriptional regulator